MLTLLLALFIALHNVPMPAKGRVVDAPRALSAHARTDLVTSFGKRSSHNGRYTAQVISVSDVGVDVPQSWIVHLDTRGRRVAHATVEARAWMPDSAEAPSIPFAVRYARDGNYTMDNVALPAAGWWNLALTIRGRNGVDSVAFNVVIPPARSAGQ